MDRIITITTEQVMSREQRERLLTYIKSQLPSSGFIVLLLQPGVQVAEIGVERITLPDTDASWLEQFSQAEVARAFGVPVELVKAEITEEEQRGM